jgi:transposase
MIPIASGVRVWIAVGHTDMRRGMNSLALQVQEGLKRDPHAGDLYVFRGKCGHLIKILWHDGIGTTALACRSMPSGWSAAVSSGRRRRMAW